ncbi:quinone-dependent dihydroorotate dehydrogenase [bacterium SCSIO 12643]|nr:quinone-dependent dihydroorotate dehydrogenase [bacterium SCSIO 12643]
MYKSIIRPILFQFNPEKAHHMVMGIVKVKLAIPGVKSIFNAMFKSTDKRLERTVFGIKFPNPVGLAAGFDKNADYYKQLAHLGFGFIEIGTVTPVAQPGNPKPRMFRLPEDSGLINRMGFNNGGLELAIENLKSRPKNLIIGGNIGKNKVTPNAEALNDYIKAFNGLYDYVDYFVVNVSSPNTPGLRELQDKGPLTEILNALQIENKKRPQTKPILLKIAPDLTPEQLDDIIDIIQTTKTDGVIATNTTISRDGLKTDPKITSEMGGLSGKPVKSRSTEVIKYLYQKSNGSFPIIGVGGIQTAQDAIEKLEAGASLVQVYTGFIYEGPYMIKRICDGILKHTS